VPAVSFVIIEYHSVPDVLTCAESIKVACSSIPFEIIVSSNSTYPEEKKADLLSRYPALTWVFNPANGGFAYGMNAGLHQSKGRIIVITNPDVRINNDNLTQAFRCLESNSDIGVIGPKIVDDKGLLQDTCRPFMTPLKFLSRIPQRLFRKKDVLLDSCFDYASTQSVDWVIGAFMIVRREAFEKVGGLDEGYFLYVEDMDWCKRFWDQGYKVVYFPDLEVEYKGDRKSTSTLFARKNFNKYAYYHFKSYLRFLYKHGFNPSR
jgi:hypothetical protein